MPGARCQRQRQSARATTNVQDLGVLPDELEQPVDHRVVGTVRVHGRGGVHRRAAVSMSVSAPTPRFHLTVKFQYLLAPGFNR